MLLLKLTIANLCPSGTTISKVDSYNTDSLSGITESAYLKVIQDSLDNLYYMGKTAADSGTFLTKEDSGGTLIWSKHYYVFTANYGGFVLHEGNQIFSAFLENRFEVHIIKTQ